MKRTDYSLIAGKYDDSAVRRQIPRDDVLSARLGATPQRPFAVLDLACGTGNYLQAQMVHHAKDEIVWHGLDASKEMLAVARGKVEGVSLVHGRAEQLPFESASLDYVANNFAFHHFEDKTRVLDEIHRVLRPGGALRMRNIASSHMRGWWIYRFFPSAWMEDEKRFWSPELLFHELSSRGFSVEIRIEVRLSRVSWSEVVADAQRRDISELHLISATEYEAGLDRARRCQERDPGGGVPSALALLDCTALVP